MPAVSIILPVYNAQAFLASAVESVLKQTFSDFELILVDDGSADGSLAICKAFARRDRRIVVITQKNGGVSAARNAGLFAAKGEYIAFCDQDDCFLPHLLAENYPIAKDTGAEVVKFARRSVVIDAKGATLSIHENSGRGVCLYCRNELRRHYRILSEKLHFLYVWNGLYRRSFLLKCGVSFNPDFRFGEEDRLFNLQLVPHIRRLAVNGRIGYIHNKRISGSTSCAFHEGRIDAILQCMREDRSLAAQLHIAQADRALVEAGYFSYLLLYLAGCQPALKPAAQKEILRRLRSQGFFWGVPLCPLWKNSRRRAAALLLYRHRLYGLLWVFSAVYGGVRKY